MHLGYNKRPKIRDSQGNIIAQGDSVFAFGKKGPNGEVEFKSIPPFVHHIDYSVLPPLHQQSLRIYGGNFNQLTTLEIPGISVDQYEYVFPWLIVATISTTEDLGNYDFIINNGVEVTFKNLLSVSNGNALDVSAADFLLQGMTYEEQSFIKDNADVKGNGLLTIPFSGGNDFEISMTIEPEFLGMGGYYRTYIGVRDKTAGVIENRNGAGYMELITTSAGALSAKFYGEGSIADISADFYGAILTFRRLNGVLSFYKNGELVRNFTNNYTGVESEFYITELQRYRITNFAVFVGL